MSGDSFSLDDIRDVFARDMREFLGKVEESAASIAETSWLSESAPLGENLVQDLRALLGAFHGVEGDDLVREEWLSLLGCGAESVERWVHAFMDETQRASYLGDVVRSVLPMLRDVLEKELEDDSDSARVIASQQLEELQAALELLEGSIPGEGERAEGDLDRDRIRLPESFFEVIWPEGDSDTTEIFSRIVAHPFLDPEFDGNLIAQFQTIESSAHAMSGSSALVGRESLSSLTHRLEIVAGAARWIAQHLDFLRELSRTSVSFVSLCLSIDQSLDEESIELIRERAESALRLDDAFVIRAKVATLFESEEGELPTVIADGVEPSDTVESDIFDTDFAFGDDGLGEPFRDESNDESLYEVSEELDQELLEIFRIEAEETVGPMSADIEALRRNPDDKEVAQRLERIFHTIKGAAATVGLNHISECAAEIEDSFDPILADEQQVDGEFVDQLLAKSNNLLAISGLGELRLQELGGQGSKPHSLQLLGMFVEESESAVRRIETTLDSMEPGDILENACYTGVCESFESLRDAAALADREDVAEILDIVLFEVANDPHRDVFIERSRHAIVELNRLFAGHRSKIELAAKGVLETVESLGRETVTLETGSVWEAFELEVQEILESLDRSIESLDKEGEPLEKTAEALFRDYHTLKGALNTVGLPPLGRVVHRVEDFLESMTQGLVSANPQSLSSLLCWIQDLLRRGLIESANGFVEVDYGAVDAQFNQLQSGAALSVPARRPLPALVETKEAEASEGTQLKKFIRVPAERLDSMMNFAGELMVNRSRLMRRLSALNSLRMELMSSKKRLLNTVDDFRDRYEFSGLERRARGWQFATSLASSAGAMGAPSVGGFDSDLLESFSDLEMDRYEDINILARSLHEISNDINEISAQIGTVLDLSTEDTDTFSSIVSGLQNEITRARMVPIEQLFIRLRRPIKDAATDEGRRVLIEVIGETVTLDKSLVDQLYAPMLHVVRNCVSHGVESPAERRAKGKDEFGVVTLLARQNSGQVVMEISDDGAGLDLANLHRKGIERGLLSPDTPLDSPQVKDLIFLSGFSVRDSVSSTSGRGVGCDVIRREVQKLNGQIEVRSEPGKGTTFVITLPLTLAVFRAMVVELQGQKFAIPTNFAERILHKDDSHVVTSGGVDRIEVDGAYVSLCDLGHVFGVPLTESGIESRPTILLRIGDQRLGIQVDKIHGQEEIVVKRLGSLLVGHPLFSGVTISGDGDLILIVDIPGLTQGFTDASLRAMPRERSEIIENSPEESDSSSKIRVLYIDDSLSVRKAAEKLLLGLGVDVTLAVDGVDGLDKIRAQKFDLVFSDLEMPRLNGYDLIRELRFIQAFNDLPVIVVTSRSGAKHRKQADTVGATDYITKPFNKEVLRSALSKWSSFVSETG